MGVEGIGPAGRQASTPARFPLLLVGSEKEMAMSDLEKSTERKFLCRVFKKEVPAGRGRRSLRIPPPEESPEIQEIKGVIPLILSLPTSWNCPEHIGWQMLRLNKKYRQDFDQLYRDHRNVGSNQFLFGEFPPREQEAFEDYEIRATELAQDLFASQAGLWRGSKIDRNALIPYFNRFPNPLIRPLLPLDKLRAHLTRRGHPTNWLKDLLVYELSMAGVRNAEIGRLIFKIGSSRPSAGNPKHPVLVKIAKIKKTIEKLVEAYLITKSPYFV